MIREDKELMKILDTYEYAGINIIHATKDEIDYNVFNGYKSIEDNTRVDEDTIYRIASISKTVLAVCALTLVEKGKLDIYTDISNYLGFKVRNPKYPNTPITIEMLMTQTSSINDGDWQNDLGYDGVNGPVMEVKLEDLLNNTNYKYYTPKTYLDAMPGSLWRYSNFGCGILACIIEKASGMPYIEYVKNVLLDPLGIDGGYSVKQVKAQDEVASLYEWNDKLVLERDVKKFNEVCYPVYELGNNFRGPAGGLFISPKNLAKIMMMLMNKGIYKGVRILKEETINDMFKIHWQGVASDPQYKKKGLQLILLDGYSKQTLKGHFGCAYGLRSFMLFNEDNGYIFMCNGANYKEFQEHMVLMEKEVLLYLVKKFEGEIC